MNRPAGQKGYILIFHTLLFMAILTALVVGGGGAILSNYAAATAYVSSEQSFLAADSAAAEGAYRLMNGLAIPPGLVVSLPSGSASVTVSDILGGKRIVAAGRQGGYQRNIQTDWSFGAGISFHYGIQSGQGGFVLQNSSSVIGNVFSAGSVTGTGNFIYGDVISAGPSGLIDNVHATGTAYAHIIEDSRIDKDAYYATISGSTVGGVSHPNSPDQPIAALPISDSQIGQWESQAAAGGSATCKNGAYTVNSDASLGPIKIPCDLQINGTGGGITVTISGPIWVTGNITVTNKATIQMAASLGNQNVAVIADNPSNPAGSGIINIGQNTVFQGSGASGSYVFMISQNNSAEGGGGADALVMNNGASALVAYASHGQITLSQSVGVKEVTAYKIILKNSASVTYDSGLPNVLFSAGPGGGYTLLDWAEI